MEDDSFEIGRVRSLSQLSQGSILSEGGSGRSGCTPYLDRFCISDVVEGEDMEIPCSQPTLSQEIPFCTPDFITPVEQQFHIDTDDVENVGPNSPGNLSPVRPKRPRREERFCPDSSQESEKNDISDNPSCSNRFQMPTARTPLATSTNLHLNYIKPNSRAAQFASLRRRVQSPPCHSNPFLNPEHHENDSCDARKAVRNLPPCVPSSRYRAEFHEVTELGRGSFSKVFKVVSRLDGCTYAVKKSLSMFQTVSERKMALQEVQALAAAGYHPNFIRYFTAWFESEHLFIQTELCDDTLASLHSTKQTFDESEILEILSHLVSALRQLHSRGIAHLDIKPENIFLQEGMYKIGDFGHATALDGGVANVEEGDARYLAPEILQSDYQHLDRADIFSMGAMAYELARGSSLPISGPQYQQIRQGKLTLLPGYSLPFQQLIKAMLHEDPVTRPSAEEVLVHSLFCK
ncbi:hypothetical protein CYMTET_11256 [Cymbomonas tetramitiformis]|uniref:Protein kinase domain-containing protein n=1 Tax=Cymbomonas tetramitiformis TaxID=36881 RepID=A0AAE0GP24_9CHLO|nr:hypothetical protein CYMTET_11256 [Cymbomonas tetramitiformis]